MFELMLRVMASVRFCAYGVTRFGIRNIETLDALRDRNRLQGLGRRPAAGITEAVSSDRDR